jgi:predicted DNA-binding transcriptional regulator AlpA
MKQIDPIAWPKAIHPETTEIPRKSQKNVSLHRLNYPALWIKLPCDTARVLDYSKALNRFSEGFGMQEKLDPILSEKDLAKWLDTSRPTLQRQRSDGSGPPFVQLSERRIGYRKSAVEQWLAARTINRIGEPVAKPPKPAEQSTR